VVVVIEYGKDWPDPMAAQTAPVLLDECHATFRRWLGDEYDLDALDAVLCAAAAERLDGDPLWLLVVSGPGAAKTETVQALVGIGAHVTSTISSEAALLSGSPKHEQTKTSTGGLLRKIGSRGVLVLKDFTTILAMDSNTRGGILAALREIHDGRWERNLGTQHGQTLTWTGRIVVVGAVTTAWDSAHAVVSSLGDRFALVRLDSTAGRVGSYRRAVGNTGDESRMRAEMADAVKAVVENVDPDRDDLALAADEVERLGRAADLVTLARTGVITDYKGEVIDAHAPEMPTRFAKQLVLVFRAAVCLGMDRGRAIDLAVRCARDSMPPLRLAIIDDVAEHPASSLAVIRRRLDKPRDTVRRQLDALHLLGVVTVTEFKDERGAKDLYSLAGQIDPAALRVRGNTTTHTSHQLVGGMYGEGSHIPAYSSPQVRRGEMSTCAGCNRPMHVVEDGQTHHPACADIATSTEGQP
jgi:hypothetical protein